MYLTKTARGERSKAESNPYERQNNPFIVGRLRRIRPREIKGLASACSYSRPYQISSRLKTRLIFQDKLYQAVRFF